MGVITAASPRRYTSVVLFAGAGGSCTGIAAATGQSPMLAINHNPIALASHAANHPATRHLCEDVFQAQPWRVWHQGQDLWLLWTSPDCTHFSRAKGGAPVSAGRRSLADAAIDWAAQARPRVLMLENVPEFLTWGPLIDGQPDKTRAGEHFRAWVLRLQLLGYRVEWRVLRACDYGTPTIRKRLYLIARCDGRPIVWPEPTHGPGLLPYRSAAECIDWSDMGTSIFNRPRPLAEKTMARIFEGLRRFVVEAPEPFILNLSHGGRLESLAEPMRTVTAGPKGGDRALVMPWLQSTANGERAGQAPRVGDIQDPLATVTATGSPGALGVAWLAKHYGGPRSVCGSDLRAPLGTVTTQDHHSLVAAYLVQYYGTGGQGSHPADPLPAVVTKARHGLVTVTLQGQEWAVQDITLRMLKPRELARAQGFPDDYQILGTTAEQIAQIGNAVCPPVAEALVRANMECVA